MPSEVAQRLSLPIAALGAVLTAIVAFTWGGQPALSAGIGAGLALLNWQLLKWLLTRLLRGELRERGQLITLALLKMAALMFTAYGALRLGLVRPLPFTVGLSALPGGLLLGSFFYILFGKPSHGAGPAGSEH